MELIRPNTNFNFMKYRWMFISVSLSLILWSIFLWSSTGASKYSVDFLGGIELLVQFEKPIEIDRVRQVVSDSGAQNAIVQAFKDGPNIFSIRTKSDASADKAKTLHKALEQLADGQKFTLLREDVIGPVIGDEVATGALYALAFSLLGQLIYITARFEFRFALGAIVALLHDVIITTGVYIYSGREIDAATVAAMLTIIGYSVNDTIIVFDRVRENILHLLKKAGKKESSRVYRFSDILNQSVNQTLSRTVLTSLTVLFSTVALWRLGGEGLSHLAFPLVIGVIVGSYSTIFIASPVVWMLEPRGDSKTASTGSQPAKKL